MLIYFPELHEELVAEKIKGAALFDPGIDREDKGDIPVFRPDSLPVEPHMCRRMVDDFVSYGESLGKMFKFIASPPSNDKDQFGERTSAIQNELNARLSPDADSESSEAAMIQNQVVLALVYAYEEKHLELLEIEKSLSDKWSGFGESLGIDEDEDERKAMALGELISNAPGVGGSSLQLPWQKVLEGFALLLPEKTVLVTSDVDAVAVWRDLEFDFFENEGLLPEKTTVLREKVWKLLGLSSLPEDRPWLDREFTIALAPGKA
ncbi:hypothetical protein [Maridesulfovibrio hydrothermalis]|uniref:Uncharacterized protein n=1 Tax=Maridesulfovibrio hydrothermalis AM13 = DSM 14728 TaxID=1121451 RepID=L0RGU3_9BACT|nr:hypothetical protein [Maridesulfovibrio hydrothermalis]CCO24811.1 conserved protein of unknown function [Maridesulfovibrio hydrothermalis AM13 = DSM 14728]